MAEHEEIREDTTESLPAADVKVESGKDHLTVAHNFEVKQSESKLNDTAIIVFESSLRKCRSKLESLEKQEISLTEVLLGISTASLGGILGALASGVPFELTFGSISFYVFLPMLLVGCLVAYIFKRKEQFRNPSNIARDLLEELPDPDKTISLDKKNIE